MDESPPHQRQLSRRRTLAAIGTLTLGGGAALALGTDDAAAAEVTASFSVPDAAYRDEEPPHTAWLRASGSWSYSGLTVDPSAWRIRLRAGKTAENQDRIAETAGLPFGFDEQGTFAVQGALIDAGAFDSADLAPAADGETRTVTVHASVVFEVLDGDYVLASAEASGSGTLTIEDTTATYTASLDAAGSWDWQANSTDPTPTP